MQQTLGHKLNGIYWDLSPKARKELLDRIYKDPQFFFNDEFNTIRLLETLTWYELIQLIGSENLFKILNETTINRLFPEARRKYYLNAKRLLSKYIIPTTG